MGRNISAQEHQEDLQSRFPPALVPLYSRLENQVIHLHIHWKNFKLLYATSEETVSTLNWAAERFFGDLQNILWRYILLEIAKLTDRPTTGRYENLSFERLVQDLRGHLNHGCLQKVEVTLNELCDKAKNLRKQRSKKIAHTDLEVILNPHLNRVPTSTIKDVEELLALIRSLLNEINKLFGGDLTIYEEVLSIKEADELLHRLRQARLWEEHEEREFRKKYGLDEDDVPE